jgi:hypothetical protein
MPELRKLVSAPQFMLTSASAVAGLARLFWPRPAARNWRGRLRRNVVILVIGAQKIVRDLDEAFRRVEEYCLP